MERKSVNISNDKGIGSIWRDFNNNGAVIETDCDTKLQLMWHVKSKYDKMLPINSEEIISIDTAIDRVISSYQENFIPKEVAGSLITQIENARQKFYPEGEDKSKNISFQDLLYCIYKNNLANIYATNESNGQMVALKETILQLSPTDKYGTRYPLKTITGADIAEYVYEDIKSKNKETTTLEIVKEYLSITGSEELLINFGDELNFGSFM